MVAIETSIESLAAQLQNETLKDILARDTVDRLTLTFRTHVLSRHYVDPVIERAGSNGLSGTMSKYDTMTGRLPWRERALPGQAPAETADRESTRGWSVRGERAIRSRDNCMAAREALLTPLRC